MLAVRAQSRLVNSEPADRANAPASDRAARLREVAGAFLRLGATSFGGPAVHIALMEDEFVRRRGWLDRDHYLDLVGATNVIPGPNSTEVAIHLGYLRAGWPGLIVAGVCFIAPAALMTLALAGVYVRYGALPDARPFLAGVQPVVLALLLATVWRLGRPAVKNVPLAVVGALVLIASLALGVPETPALFGGGVLGALWLRVRDRRRGAPPGRGRAGGGDLVGGLAWLGGRRGGGTDRRCCRRRNSHARFGRARPVFPQDRRAPVRQRLRSGGVFGGRAGG
jgi:chromate transporter